MILTEAIETKWSAKNRKHYESLGYVYSGNLSILTVKVNDLPSQSHTVVEMLCDTCKKDIRTIPYREFVKNYSNKEYHCKSCSINSKFNKIIADFKNRGYYIVSDISEYTSVTSKVKYICKEHEDRGILEIRVSEFNSGSGCKFCGTEKAADSIRTDYSTVVEAFGEKGLSLLTKEYKTSNQLLDFICNNHTEKGIQKIRYRAVKDGQGCKFCGRESAANKKKHSLEFVKSEFEKRDYILLDEEYVQTREKLNFKCKAHPDEIQQIEFRALYNQNQGCRFCAIESNSGENNWNWKGGISPLSTYLRQFLTEWKKESFKRSNYRCVISGEKSNGNFEVHHLLAVNSIIAEIIKDCELEIKSKIQDYTESELNLLIDSFVLENNKLYGVVLKPRIHKLYHQLYGYGDNTPEQFEEFKQRYNNREFDELLIS